MRIRLGSLSFLGDAGSCEFDVAPDGLKGWLKGGVGVRRDKPDRPTSHGQFLLPGFRTGRSISWTGLVHSSSGAEQDHQFQRLTGMLGAGESGRMVVDSAAGEHWADVVLEDVEIERLVYGRLAKYRVQVWCPSPFLRGESRKFTGSGSVSAFHYGNTPAPMVTTVSGTATSGYTLTMPGGTVTVSRLLTSGNPHKLDLASGVLLVGGNRYLGGLGVFNPAPLKPGAPSTVSVSGGLTLSVEVVDTFV